MRSFKGILLSTLVIASIMALAVPLLSTSPVHATLTPHDPIYIDGNGGFTSPDPVNGGGSGTENDPYIIENWVINAENANGIEIRNTTAYFVVRNCVVENGGGTYGIYLYNSVNGRVENNTCRNNGLCGIFLYYLVNNRISNNTCENNHYSIYLYRSDNNTLSKNICENNLYGIVIDDSQNNTLTNNTCENNDYGITLWFSMYNRIFHNILESNGYGICSQPSMNNSIYHNNFINNVTQAYDDGANYWDNGYPSGGNYWSDLVPTKYNIPGDNNQDRYPLGEPWSPVELSLVAGWNLVGFPATSSDTTPANLFAGQNYYIWEWNAISKTYISPPSNQPVELGVGYWVWVDHDQTITVPL